MTDLCIAEPEIRYPLLLPDNPWRRALKVGLGRIALALLPRRAEQLLADGDPMDFSTIDRLVVTGWMSRAARTADWPALSALHQRFWEGRGGAAFNTAPEIARRFEEWFLGSHARALETLRRQLDGQHCRALCEIGSGNGLALEHASRTLTQIPRFIGVDINRTATKLNAQRWHDDPRLEFVHADAAQWITHNAEPGWAYFSNAGVLEYFPQATVEKLYRRTASLGGPAWWVLTEPVYRDYDLATETESRPSGPEFSFSHNHPHLLRRAGWEVVEVTETETAGMRFLSVCARLP